MKKRLTYFLSFLLSINVLMAGIGLPVYVQTCLMSGARQVSLLPPQGCCSEKPVAGTHCFSKKSCCDEEVNYFKTLPVTAKVAQRVDLPVLHFVAVVFTGTQLLPLASSPELLHPLANGPPIALSGRDILSNNQVFRI